jgi:hypothetical protein
MRFYADTSCWLGYKCRRDTQHQAALSLFEREPEAEVLWTPWHVSALEEDLLLLAIRPWRVGTATTCRTKVAYENLYVRIKELLRRFSAPQSDRSREITDAALAT